MAVARIPGDDRAAVAARTRIHLHDGADVREAGLILNREGFVIHAIVIRRHDEVAGLRIERGGLLIFTAHGRRTDAGDVLARLRGLGGDDGRTAGRHVHFRRPVYGRVELLREQQFAGAAVQLVSEPVAVEVHERRDLLAVDGNVGEDHLVHAVVIPRVVRRHLIAPLRQARVGVTSEDGHRPLVIAGALRRVPRARVSGAVVQ